MTGQTQVIKLKPLFISTVPPLGPKNELREAVERVIWGELRPGATDFVGEPLQTVKVAGVVNDYSRV